MSESARRRPLPALAFLLVLTVLTAIVWWRVLHRPGASTPAAAPTTVQPARCTPGAKAVRLPNPRAVTVDVLNGAGRYHLATDVSTELKSRGFTMGTPNSTAALGGVAEIRFGMAGRAGATLLSYHVPGAKLVLARRPDARIDLVLGSGFHALASPAAVSRTVASAKKAC